MGICSGHTSAVNPTRAGFLPPSKDCSTGEASFGRQSEVFYQRAEMKSQSTQTFLRKNPNNRQTQDPVRVRRGVLAISTIKAVINQTSPPQFRRMQQLQSIATKDYNHPTLGGSNYTGGELTVVAHDFLDSPVAKAFESPRFSDASCISFNEIAKSDMNSLMIFSTAEIARGITYKADQEAGLNLYPNARYQVGAAVGNKPRKSFFKYKDLSAATSNFEFRIQKVPKEGDAGYQNYASPENLPISPITRNDQEFRPANTEVSPRSSLGSKVEVSADKEASQRKPFPFNTQEGKRLQLVRIHSTAIAQTCLCTIRKEFNIPEQIRLGRCRSLILDQRNSKSSKYMKPIFNKLAEHEAVDRLPSRGQKFIPRRSFTLSNAYDSMQHKLGSSGDDLSAKQHRMTVMLEKSHLSSFAIPTTHKPQLSSTSLAINCPDSQALSPYKQRLQNTQKMKYSGYFPIVVKQSLGKKLKMSDFERKLRGIHKRKLEGLDSQPKPMIFINGEFHCLLK